MDEAGRGPLCGPVCAAAVILPPDAEIEGLNDSKKLSESRREQLYDVNMHTAVSVGVGWASPEQIDKLNILNATFSAMRSAIDSMPVKPALALIDGNRAPGLQIPTKCIVKGDSLSMSIAAASVIAKVSRDRLMQDLAAVPLSITCRSTRATLPGSIMSCCSNTESRPYTDAVFSKIWRKSADRAKAERREVTALRR